MAANQVPSATDFVIQATDRKAVMDRLSGLGKVDDLAGSSGLLLLEMQQKAGDPKSSWIKVRDALDKAGTVYPVLLDESGAPQYPTGEVTVRFHSNPTDEDLRRFAKANGLRLRNRNEFVPQQAVFETSDPKAHYLPDLVKTLQAAGETSRAWANTLARYQRS